MYKATQVYKIIKPQVQTRETRSNNDTDATYGVASSMSWYNQLTQGSAQRLNKYRYYDAMDSDIDVSRALDIIAEEMTGNNPKTNLPLEIQYDVTMDRHIENKVATTLHSALITWCKIQKWDTRLFQIARNTIKYGDTFFIRGKNHKVVNKYISSKYVTGAITNKHNKSDVKGWMIEEEAESYDNGGLSNFSRKHNAKRYNATDIVRFSMNDDMSDEAPFGKSILATVFKTFKQKELLEDSLIIYRIQRAPERRVFYIDTSGVPTHKVSTHLEQIKNEVNQKKIPVTRNNEDEIESIYNPNSMQEDYFFSIGKGGTGSRVETLPGGQGLGELEDLNYFFYKLWRGLRIPQSYMDTNNDSAMNDGKVGIAYMQEIKFALYVERLQKSIEVVMDREFKRFLRDSGINVDQSLYHIILPEPSNYSKSRQQSMDGESLGNYANVASDNNISKRFALKRYLQWSEEDIALNEKMLREEKGLNPNGGVIDLPQIYNPEAAEAGGFEGGLGGSSDLGNIGGDLGDIDANPAGGDNQTGNQNNQTQQNQQQTDNN